MLRLPALLGPKKPPASDCERLNKVLTEVAPLGSRFSRTPFGVPRLVWLSTLVAKADSVRL